MTLTEFINKSHEIRKKHDILLLADLITLYDERYRGKRKKVPIEYIYNELHDTPKYTEEEKDLVICEALNIIKSNLR